MDLETALFFSNVPSACIVQDVSRGFTKRMQAFVCMFTDLASECSRFVFMLIADSVSHPWCRREHLCCSGQRKRGWWEYLSVSSPSSSQTAGPAPTLGNQGSLVGRTQMWESGRGRSASMPRARATSAEPRSSRRAGWCQQHIASCRCKASGRWELLPGTLCATDLRAAWFSTVTDGWIWGRIL